MGDCGRRSDNSAQMAPHVSPLSGKLNRPLADTAHPAFMATNRAASDESANRLLFFAGLRSLFARRLALCHSASSLCFCPCAPPLQCPLLPCPRKVIENCYCLACDAGHAAVTHLRDRGNNMYLGR